MSQHEAEPDWKLKLRCGELRTPFAHFTAIAEGIVGDLAEGLSCRPGPAFMGMKTWADSSEESAHMMRIIGREIGFTVTGDIRIYETDPMQPPGEHPTGYDINFTPFDAEEGVS